MFKKQERFSLRKLSVGLASVMIGVSLWGLGSKTVHAEVSDSTPKSEKIVQQTPTAENNINGLESDDHHSESNDKNSNDLSVSSYKPNVEENADTKPTENDTAHDPFLIKYREGLTDDQKKLVDDYGHQLDKRAIDNMSEQVKNPDVKAYLDKNNFISIGGGTGSYSITREVTTYSDDDKPIIYEDVVYYGSEIKNHPIITQQDGSEIITYTFINKKSIDSVLKGGNCIILCVRMNSSLN